MEDKIILGISHDTPDGCGRISHVTVARKYGVFDVEYQCCWCKKNVKKRIEIKQEHFIGLGDESIYKNIVAYSIVAFMNTDESLLRNFLNQKKHEFNIPENEEIHCKVLFHKDAREKTCWKTFQNEPTIFLFLKEILGNIRKFMPIDFCVGVVDFPDYQRKWNLYNSVSVNLTHDVMIPILFQAATKVVEQRGFSEEIQFIIDQNKKKILFYSATKKRQIQSMLFQASDLVDTSKIQASTYDKTPLLELADIAAYIVSHSLCPGKVRNKKEFQTLYQIMKPIVAFLDYNPETTVEKTQMQITHDNILANLE